MPSFSLRLRILLTTSLIVVGTMTVALGLVGWVTRGVVNDAVRRASERTSAVLRQDLTLEFDRLRTEAALLADRPGTRTIHGTDSASISDHLDEVRGRVHADWIVMIDADGSVIGQSQGSPLRVGAYLGRDEAIKELLGGRSGTRIMSSPSGPSLTTGQTIQLGDYVPAALILGSSVNQSFLERVGAAAGVELAVSENGFISAATLPVPARINLFKGVKQIDTNGQRYAAWLNPFQGPDASTLSFVCLMPESVITAPFAPLWNSLIGLFAAGVAVSILAGLALAKTVTDPLDRLMAAAKEIQQGHYPIPFDSKRGDEIGVLQNAFDDMTDSLRSSRDRLVAMLQVDPLTELMNYRCFREKLEDRIIESQASGEDLALVILDIDSFEHFNRTKGVESGDDLLKNLAGLLRQSDTDWELTGRIGGNEFAFAVDGEAAAFLAERLRKSVEAELGITVSVGVSQLGGAIENCEMLFLASKMAVGQAKSAGRNRVREFSGFAEGMDAEDLRQILQDGSYAAVRALAEAVDAKDEYTRGHSRRVAEYGRMLAEAAGMDPGFVELVYISGTLHDVGKIGVPDQVLKKPDRLTDEEFELIKLHPEHGEKIVAQIPQLKDTLPGVRSHHERWDGRGYPDRLAGEDIPLLGRILAIADTYDAMTSDRPYRKGLSIEIAESEIMKGLGSQFDPELGQVFLDRILPELRRAA